MRDSIHKVKLLVQIVFLIIIAIVASKISWDLGYKEATTKTQVEREQEKSIANKVVVKSAELYNLSELKYTTLARETSNCQLSNKTTGLKLDYAKDKQMQLLLEVKDLIKQLGIEQDLMPVPGESKNL